MNRRDLIQKVIVGGTVLVFVPSVLESCSKGSPMDPGTNPGGGNPPPATRIDLDLSLAANSSLNTKGSSKIVQNIIIINTGNGFTALSSICTHQGCTVGYNGSANDLQCPCHGSVFSISGSVINGPALTPLRSYPVSQTGTVLTVQI